MAYLRPPAFQRKVFNTLAMLTGIGGSQSLSVAGRKSGKMLKLPVIPIDVEGVRYSVSTRGESAWVRNLRAAGGKAELRAKGKTQPVTVTEIPVAERPPIISAYRAKVGREVNSYFEKLPNPEDHPMFKISG